MFQKNHFKNDSLCRFVCEQLNKSVFFYFYISNHSELLLSFFLLLQQLHLPPDVAAVALRGHVLPVRLYVLAGQNLRVNGGLKFKIINILEKNTVRCEKQVTLPMHVYKNKNATNP